MSIRTGFSWYRRILCILRPFFFRRYTYIYTPRNSRKTEILASKSKARRQQADVFSASHWNQRCSRVRSVSAEEKTSNQHDLRSSISSFILISIIASSIAAATVIIIKKEKKE